MVVEYRPTHRASSLNLWWSINTRAASFKVIWPARSVSWTQRRAAMLQVAWVSRPSIGYEITSLLRIKRRGIDCSPPRTRSRTHTHTQTHILKRFTPRKNFQLFYIYVKRKVKRSRDESIVHNKLCMFWVVQFLTYRNESGTVAQLINMLLIYYK